MCGPHQVWPLRSECCGRGVPTKVVCAECMRMCCLGGKNSVVKGLILKVQYSYIITGTQGTAALEQSSEAVFLELKAKYSWKLKV